MTLKWLAVVVMVVWGIALVRPEYSSDGSASESWWRCIGPRCWWTGVCEPKCKVTAERFCPFAYRCWCPRGMVRNEQGNCVYPDQCKWIDVIVFPHSIVDFSIVFFFIVFVLFRIGTCTDLNERFVTNTTIPECLATCRNLNPTCTTVSRRAGCECLPSFVLNDANACVLPTACKLNAFSLLLCTENEIFCG